jgi:glutaredoxin
MEYRKQMLAFSKGDPTVPVIVENGKLKQVGWEGRG